MFECIYKFAMQATVCNESLLLCTMWLNIRIVYMHNVYMK